MKILCATDLLPKRAHAIHFAPAPQVRLGIRLRSRASVP